MIAEPARILFKYGINFNKSAVRLLGSVTLYKNNIKRNGRFQVTYSAYSMEKYTNSTIIIPAQPLTNRAY